MEIVFLGTGAGLPAKSRNVSSVALRLLDERNEIWLFDCGEGTQHQILETTIRPGKIKKIFITHLHGDHIFGLPGFLSSRSFQGGEEALTIYGPKGIREFVQASIRLSASKLSYDLQIVEIHEDGLVFDEGDFKVFAQKLDHGIPSWGFRLEEADQVGQLQAQALIELGLPMGPLFGRLKKGESVQLEDGRIIHGKDYLSPDIPGRVVTILGDTRYCPQAIELARGADLLVHEATYHSQEEKKAKSHFHSTSQQAALVASQAGVKQLLLTHISSRYLGPQALVLRDDAQTIFPNVYVVKDFDSFEIVKEGKK